MAHMSGRKLLRLVWDGSRAVTMCRRCAQSHAAAADPSELPRDLKPLSAMPGPRGYPVIGNLPAYMGKDGYKMTKLFVAMQDQAEKYGPVYREKVGGTEYVIVSDPAEYLKVIRVDGTMPRRFPIEPIQHHRRRHGYSVDIVNSHGEQWYRHRSAVNHKMLRPKEVLDYVPQMNAVADDFMARLKRLMTSSGHVPELQNEVFKWSLESIGTVLFSTRLGIFNDLPSKRAQDFLDNLAATIIGIHKLQFGVPLYQLWPTKKWKEFDKVAKSVIDIGMEYVQDHLDEIAAGKGSEDGMSLLMYLLERQHLGLDEANLLVADLLGGAVETTSTAIQWVLYNLAKFPHIQDALYSETCAVLPDPKQPITAEILPKLHYVKHCLKETLRLYPIAFSTSRLISKDIELGGYLVPKGTHVRGNVYGMSRNPTLFTDPNEFIPERWLRDGEEDKMVPQENKFIAGLVWGHGPRMCIGRRMAEQELFINITKFVQNFRMEHQGELEPESQLVMVPDRKLDLKFIPRH